jgi:septum formation protein
MSRDETKLSIQETSQMIYLASASPRRTELLAQLGVNVRVTPVEIDESVQSGEKASAYVARLALEKSRVASASLAVGESLVLAADTTVVIDDLILGKPCDAADAKRMLRLLSGRTHAVLTAVSLRNKARESVVVSRTEVKFRALEADEIAAYWDGGEPADKAGAYAIQGMGAIFIEAIRGSYSGVMGLPLFETARLLRDFGYRLRQSPGIG